MDHPAQTVSIDLKQNFDLAFTELYQNIDYILNLDPQLKTNFKLFGVNLKTNLVKFIKL